MPIRAGELDRRITIQTPTGQKNQFGEEEKSWSEVDTVYAGYRPLRGNELITAQQILIKATAKFILRWRDDLTERMRIVFENRNYNIEHIAEIGRRQGLEIIASFEQGSSE